MADTKISGLPASTTPLAGTEVLPIVQSGSTVKVAVSDLTAGRAVSALSLTSTNGASIQGLTVGLGAGAVATNTAVGFQSQLNTTGGLNTAMGYQALKGAAASTGTDNSAFGYAALTAITTGTLNQAFGENSLASNTSGGSNNAFGQNALLTNSLGNNNVAAGNSALRDTTTGNSTAVGYRAGMLATGIGNQFFGYNSGSAVTTGAKNVILGSYTGSAAPISATGSNNIVLSDGDGVVRQTIDSSGNVGINVTPSATGGQLQVSGAVASATARFDGNANAMSVLNQKGLTLYTNLSGGFVDTTIVAGNTANTAMVFGIHNGTSYTERLRIDNGGNVLVTSVAGLGYGTGSGGAVTQATSRTTGVTLNKTNGAITLVSAAGLATFQSFTVTNSTVAATDVVHVTQKSGTDLYQIFVTATAAGSFKITFATTGGITTEQPVFNFAVIKAVTA